MKTMETTEEVSLHPGENGLASQKKLRNSPVPKNNRNDWKKVLANRWNRKRITKKAHAGRGQETIWEMSDYLMVKGIAPRPDLNTEGKNIQLNQ
jgi:hypothetical protein